MTTRRLLAGSALFLAGLLGVALVMGAARHHATIELLAAWLIPLPLTAAGFVVLWPRTGDGRGGPVMQFARWLALALGIPWRCCQSQPSSSF